MNEDPIPLDELIDTIVLEEEAPTYTALVRWTDRYPAHADRLMSFFATWAIQESQPDDAEVDESSLASRAASYALDALHQRDAQRLLEGATRSAVSMEKLAERTGLERGILVKLDARRLTRIPAACIDRLSAALGISVQRIVTMVTGPPLPYATVRYKARSKPVAAVEEFAVAVEASNLSSDLKRFWRGEVAREESKGPP